MDKINGVNNTAYIDRAPSLYQSMNIATVQSEKTSLQIRIEESLQQLIELQILVALLELFAGKRNSKARAVFRKQADLIIVAGLANSIQSDMQLFQSTKTEMQKEAIAEFGLDVGMGDIQKYVHELDKIMLQAVVDTLGSYGSESVAGGSLDTFV